MSRIVLNNLMCKELADYSLITKLGVDSNYEIIRLSNLDDDNATV